MKKIKMLTIGALLFCVCSATILNAQRGVRISGNTCTWGILTASISGADVETIEWKLNGETIASGSPRQGVTVAGGNGPGSAANQLYNPNGVFVDHDKNLWVADASNGRVQKFAPGSTTGVTVGGNLPNHPTFPVNVFVRANGEVYVADYFEGKVKRLSDDGTKWIDVAGQNNELDLVRGVWVDKNGNVYCTQYGFYFNGTVKLDGMILKYPRNSSAWQIVAGGNGTGHGLKQFSIPTSVMLDDTGNIYVADGTNDHGLSNSRVMKWTPGAAMGVIVAGGNGEGSDDNQCPSPFHAFVRSNGNVFVSTYYDKIQKWIPGATKSIISAGGNGTGSLPGQFNAPAGVFIERHYLYVVDIFNHRVQRFDLIEPNHVAQFTARHPGTYSAVITYEDGSRIESNKISIAECNEVAAPLSGKTDATAKEILVSKTIAYPNPATNSVMVNYTTQKSGQYIFEIVDLNGKILSHKEIQVPQGINRTTIDLSGVTNGLYFINIIKPDKTKELIQINKE